jgi:phage shock protein A
MTIRLVDRMATLLKADAHGVVEALEDRALLVKQALREAELELLQKRARREALADEERRLAEQLERAETDARSLDEDVALALDEDKGDLARYAARELLSRRKDMAQLSAQLADVGKTREALALRLAAQERAFDDMRQRARARLETLRRAGDPDDLLGEPDVADEEVELELLRRAQARAGDAR